MNQTKNKYERLLTLHYKLCRAEENELREIGQQISGVLQFVEKYKLFPVDLSEHFRKQLALICEGGVSDELKSDRGDRSASRGGVRVQVELLSSA